MPIDISHSNDQIKTSLNKHQEQNHPADR